MRFVVLGLGSIGKRHARILTELGHDVITVDPDQKAGAHYQSMALFEGALKETVEGWGSINGVLDCTPPDVRASWSYPPVARFIEKPLGRIPGTADALQVRTKPIQMGFCYRWIYSLERFVYFIKQHTIYSLLIVGGQHLQDWHKEDYCDVAYRYKGVVIDSLPHSLYLARWILGDLELVGEVVGKHSDLEIEVPDTAAVLLSGENSQQCFLLADYLRRPRDFYIEAVTSSNVRRWTFVPDVDVEQMYRRQMENFVQLAAGEQVEDYPDFDDGFAVQDLLDAIRTQAR